MKTPKNKREIFAQIMNFLEASDQNLESRLLQQAGLIEQVASLESHCIVLMTCQKTLRELEANLALAKNRQTARYKMARKKAAMVRHMLRQHGDSQGLLKILGAHVSQTPSSQSPVLLYGYWNNLLTSLRLLASGAYPAVSLSKQDLAQGEQLESAMELYDAGAAMCRSLELAQQEARNAMLEAWRKLVQSFHQTRDAMKKATLNDCPAWPLLEALFFPCQDGSDERVFLAEVLCHAC